MLSTLRTALQQPSNTLVPSPTRLRLFLSVYRFISFPPVLSLFYAEMLSGAQQTAMGPSGITNSARYLPSIYTSKRLPSTTTLVRWVRDSPRTGQHTAEVVAARQNAGNGAWTAEIYVNDGGSEVGMQEEKVVVVGKGSRRGLNAAIEE
jgi:hypothetical protein